MSTRIEKNPNKYTGRNYPVQGRALNELLSEHPGGLPAHERAFDYDRAVGIIALPEGVAAGPMFGPGVIETYSGLAYDFENPDPASINLLDIAHALSNACRYAGHTERFYSVAEHSVLVSRILEAWGESPVWQVLGLMHDAHEAYVWDAPRPIKPLLGEAFTRLALIADDAICRALLGETERRIRLFGIDFHTKTIKRADDTALVAESLELMTHGAARWESRPDVGPLPGGILDAHAPWTVPGRLYGHQGKLGVSPQRAKQAFLDRAAELGLEA